MSSVLNPEAPEFYPHIVSFAQEAYVAFSNTVTSSNKFPRKESYNFFKTFPDFNLLKSQFSESVLGQANELIRTEFPSVKLRERDFEYNDERLVDWDDRLLDRVDLNIDILNKEKVNDQTDEDSKPSTSASTSNNNQLIISKIKMGSSMFIGARNIPRPQLTFKDPVDNSASLWVPKISEKPNNIKPLELKLIYNEKGEAVGYENPYKVEIDLYEPPQAFIDPDPMPPTFPPPMEETKFTYINTEAQIDQLVEHLNTVQELAVDIEHHSYRTYLGITCLIQISTNEGGDFIIDTLAVREHIHKLNLSFTDPRKLKVFHGADMDVKWLQRDFGVYVVGLFDTYRAAKSLIMSGCSLKNLLMKYCQINVDKKYQLADWRMRPLPDELIEYARQDTHYLLYIWRCMKADLLAVEGGADHKLRSVFTNSKFVCATTYLKYVLGDTSHLPMYIRSKRSFDTQQMAALKMLYKWRDGHARELDESTSYLLPNHMLLSLAGQLPREVQGINALCNPMPPFVKQNILTIHRMLLSCRELSLDRPGIPMMSGSAPCFPRRLQHNVVLHDLTSLPNTTVDEAMDVDPSINEINENQPQLPAFVADEGENVNVESNLNVHADMYIPPYYRYRGYRYISQDEEMKQIEEKEAKVIAIAQGDPLIKAEVLEKLQASKKALEQPSSSGVIFIPRKRKMSTDVTEHTDEMDAQDSDNKPSGSQDKTPKTEAQNVIPFNYDDADYKHLYNDREKMRKQAKMKLAKHK